MVTKIAMKRVKEKADIIIISILFIIILIGCGKSSDDQSIPPISIRDKQIFDIFVVPPPGP